MPSITIVWGSATPPLTINVVADRFALIEDVHPLDVMTKAAADPERGRYAIAESVFVASVY
jgi:hypothetical protein